MPELRGCHANRTFGSDSGLEQAPLRKSW